MGQRTQTANRVRREVTQSYGLTIAGRQQIEISAVRVAEAEAGYREELARIQGGEGLPIELLDNLTRLITARQSIVSAIVAYDEAQFRLFVALGHSPTQSSANRPQSRPD
jgi:outer membrane protein TolC